MKIVTEAIDAEKVVWDEAEISGHIVGPIWVSPFVNSECAETEVSGDIFGDQMVGVFVFSVVQH